MNRWQWKYEKEKSGDLFHIPIHFSTLQESSLFLHFQLAYPRYEQKYFFSPNIDAFLFTHFEPVFIELDFYKNPWEHFSNASFWNVKEWVCLEWKVADNHSKSFRCQFRYLNTNARLGEGRRKTPKQQKHNPNLKSSQLCAY